MAYEQESPYTRIFDATQSPAYLDMLAARSGAEPPSVRSVEKRIYMDLGCAQGQTILGLAPLYPEVDFIGVDFNVRHVADAVEESRRLGLSNTRFIAADFRALPPDLPRAHYLIVRGIHNWLARDAKSALEAACARLAAPGGLLKLHHTVRPGALQRENLIQLMQATLGPIRTPAHGRDFVRMLAEDSPAYASIFGDGRRMLEAIVAESDEVWRHDLLNEDFAIEHAHSVLDRFERLGFHFLSSTYLARNVPAIQVSDRIARSIQALPPSRGQTLLDHAMGTGVRDDLFQREPAERRTPTYETALRFGLLVPEAKLDEPFRTARGQVLFTREDCRRILTGLLERPMTWLELRAAHPDIAPQQLVFWLDMLLAASRVGPFLPSDEAGAADRERLRRLNRARLTRALSSLSAKTTTPLLAAEYGNCLVAGWFETLVLRHFADRATAAGQRRMLEAMRGASMAFPGEDRRPAQDQEAALRRELDRLDKSYLERMGYWGIEV